MATPTRWPPWCAALARRLYHEHLLAMNGCAERCHGALGAVGQAKHGERAQREARTLKRLVRAREQGAHVGHHARQLAQRAVEQLERALSATGEHVGNALGEANRRQQELVAWILAPEEPSMK